MLTFLTCPELFYLQKLSEDKMNCLLSCNFSRYNVLQGKTSTFKKKLRLPSRNSVVCFNMYSLHTSKQESNLFFKILRKFKQKYSCLKRDINFNELTL